MHRKVSGPITFYNQAHKTQEPFYSASLILLYYFRYFLDSEAYILQSAIVIV